RLERLAQCFAEAGLAKTSAASAVPRTKIAFPVMMLPFRRSALDDQALRPLSRDPLTTTGEVLQYLAVPQPHGAALEAPLAVAVLYGVVVVPAGEAQHIGRLTLAFGDEGEAAHPD